MIPSLPRFSPRQIHRSLTIGFVAFGILSSLLMGADTLAAEAPTFTAPQLNTPIPGLNFKDYPIVVDPATGKAGITFLSAYVGAGYRYLLGISVIAAAIMIVWGGFKYIMGSVSQVEDGKNIIKDAIIGLVLIFGSYTIMATLNPDSLTELKPLNIEYIIQTPLEVSLTYSEGVPLDQQPAFARPAPVQVPPQPPAPTGGSTDGTTPSTPVIAAPPSGGGFTYKVPQAICSSQADCNNFCDNGHAKKGIEPPDGLPKNEDLAKMSDVLPPTVGQQIQEFGLALSQPQEICAGKACATTKLFAIKTHGPGASATTIAWTDGSHIYKPEVRDAFIKAGAEAKRLGYFIFIGNGTRTFKDNLEAWCQRVKASGSPQGLALPGSSPHLIGVAADIALGQLTDGGSKYRQLTYKGNICGQTVAQEQIGLEHMRTLEKIMASAGFKHLASEVHHFNFGNVYASDCIECEWRGKFAERDAQECKKQKLPSSL